MHLKGQAQVLVLGGLWVLIPALHLASCVTVNNFFCFILEVGVLIVLEGYCEDSRKESL